MDTDTFFFQVFTCKDLLRYITNFNKPIRSLFVQEHQKWLKDHPEALNQPIQNYASEIYFAVSNSNLGYFEFLIKQEKFFEDNSWAVVNTIYSLAKFEMFKILFMKHQQIFNHRPIDLAADRGRLDIIQWLHENVFKNADEGCSVTAMDWAAMNGHLKTVQWLHEHRTEGCSVSAMDFAAENGHLEMIKWLHEHRTEGCSVKAMDFAASECNLEMVKWLHENRTEGCSFQAMDFAAENGRLEMVKWLHENRDEGCSAGILNLLIKKGKLEIAEWIYRNRPEVSAPEAIETRPTIVRDFIDHLKH